MKNKHSHLDIRDLSLINKKGEPVIKHGLLFRSECLCLLNQEELAELVNCYNLKSVIDLRSDKEKKVKKEILPNKVSYYPIAVLSDIDNPAVTKETRTEILVDIYKNKGGAKKHLINIYRKLVSDSFSLEGYQKVFDILLSNKEGAIDYHCTQGKDRTGVCSALILLALGFSKESIVKDYLSYNQKHAFKAFLFSILVFLRFWNVKACRSLYLLQVAKRYFIEASFNEIEVKYGDISNFLRNGLLLDENKLNILRNKYLVK